MTGQDTAADIRAAAIVGGLVLVLAGVPAGLLLGGDHSAVCCTTALGLTVPAVAGDIRASARRRRARRT